MRAIFNGVVVAESERTIVIEGSHYFPPDSVRHEYLRPSETESICPRKGRAHYHSLIANGEENRDGAWFYPDPKEAARQIKDYVAFWKGVEIVP